MSVICLVGGGLERLDSLLGIRTVIGDNALDSPLSSGTNAPLGVAPDSGQRGVRSHAGQVGGACYIPAATTGNDCEPFAANGRNWLAVHSEIIPECLTAGANNSTYSIFKLYMPTVGGVYRDLQLLMVLGASLLTCGASAAITYNISKVTDTRRNFLTDGVVAGDWAIGPTGIMRVTTISTTTNPNDTLNGLLGWQMITSDTNPANGTTVSVYPSANANYKWRITDGTTNWDSTARACVEYNSTPYVIDFQWQPSVTVASNKVALWVNGVLEISPATSTGGFAPIQSPTVLGAGMYIGADDVAKGNVWPTYIEWYNTILYDDISQPPFDTFPITYDPLAANRPVVTFRPPKRSGSHKYTAWTPSTGADVSAMIDDHVVVDQTTYITPTATDDMASWQCKDLTLCDYPLTTADQVYAVQSIGNCSIGTGGKLSMGHTDGSTLDDAGRMVRGTTGVGQMLWCASKDPGGSPWTYAKANTCQTWVKNVTHAVGNRVNDAGQLILFRKGVSGEVPVVSTATVGTAADATVI